MATFTDFQDVLPDPNNYISRSGQESSVEPGASLGPGYASVRFSSDQPTIKDRTNSGRILARAVSSHKWKINITYNPMTRTEFEPIYNFLLQRKGALNPFFVSLPQYREPQDSSFSSWANGGVIESALSVTAGQTSFMIEGTTAVSGAPSVGDLFTINGANSNHKKAYMVTRVETQANYQTGTTQPGANQFKLYCVPGLQRSISAGDDLTFYNPLVKVILTSNVQEYSLNTNNLYSFSLNLEEVQ